MATGRGNVQENNNTVSSVVSRLCKYRHMQLFANKHKDIGTLCFIFHALVSLTLYPFYLKHQSVVPNIWE
jgi:hypothetical protein